MNHKVLRALLVLALASVPLLASVSPAWAGAPPNRLDYNGGRVLGNPAIHNLYFDFSWDSNNPPAIAGVTDFISISLWMECETAPGPDPIIRPVLTGIPKPDGNTVYAVYLPTNTQINDIAFSSCGDFGAYHFFGSNLVSTTEIVPFPPFVIPVLEPQSFAYTVVPADCAIAGAANPLDGMSTTATHELIEAATDPIIVTGWIDNSKAGFNADILMSGEAADICSSAGDVPTPSVRLTNGLLVAPYWSNADNACEPITHTFHLV